jgi:hypothetical protein
LSNLLAQRENEWTHDTAKYQNDMLEKQEIILQNQAIIAKKAKLDGTVTKWIAILTALLLPGTFIAVGGFLHPKMTRSLTSQDSVHDSYLQLGCTRQ